MKLHDGTPFTATDVVFGIERARETSDFQAPVANVTAIETIHDHTIEMTAAVPTPLSLVRTG